MKTATLHQIVDFVEQATLAAGPLHLMYDLGNGTVLNISKNLMTGGQGRFFATVPIVEGVEDYSRAEDWQTLQDVADRFAVLSE